MDTGHIAKNKAGLRDNKNTTKGPLRYPMMILAASAGYLWYRNKNRKKSENQSDQTTTVH